MNTKELQKIVKFCQKNGVKRLKTADFELEIDLKDKPIRAPKADQPIIQVSREDFDRMPTEDEMLMWSSPHFDDLIAQRKAGA